MVLNKDCDVDINQYTKPINIDLPIEKLREQYLQYFTIPPTLSNDRKDGGKYGYGSNQNVVISGNVQKVGDDAYGLIAKEIDWDCGIIEDRLGVTISTARVFITNPNSKLPIHKDCISKDQLREWAINIPLFGCDQGYNVWYKDTREYEQHQTFSGPGAAQILMHPSPVEHYREKLDTIKLLRTGIFHGVDNTDNPDYRIVLSIRCEEDLSWTEMCEKIDQFNEDT